MLYKIQSLYSNDDADADADADMPMPRFPNGLKNCINRVWDEV